jgi:hypothetical protein
MADLLATDEARRRFGGMISGLDIHYDLGAGIRWSGAGCRIST